MTKSIVIALCLIACGGKSDEPPQEPPPPPPEESRLGDRFGGLADRAEQLGSDVATKARGVGSDVVDQAKAVATKAGTLSADALAAGRRLEDQLHDTLRLADLDYDLALDAITESEADHQARLAGMKQIEVDRYTVGIARDSQHPLGTVYRWQTRITWRVRDGRAVRLSLFTNRELPELDTATTLLAIVQAAERLLPRP